MPARKKIEGAKGFAEVYLKKQGLAYEEYAKMDEQAQRFARLIKRIEITGMGLDMAKMVEFLKELDLPKTISGQSYNRSPLAPLMSQIEWLAVLKGAEHNCGADNDWFLIQSYTVGEVYSPTRFQVCDMPREIEAVLRALVKRRIRLQIGCNCKNGCFFGLF